jgi:hypothetical protein
MRKSYATEKKGAHIECTNVGIQDILGSEGAHAIQRVDGLVPFAQALIQKPSRQYILVVHDSCAREPEKNASEHFTPQPTTPQMP